MYSSTEGNSMFRSAERRSRNRNQLQSRVVSVRQKNKPSQWELKRQEKQRQANLQALTESMTGQQDEANAAAKQRYEELMSGIGQLESSVMGEGGTYDQALQGLANQGDAARRRIGEQETQQLARAEQDLTSRGLGNTTIRQSARRGVQSDAQKALTDVDLGVQAQRSGLMERKAGLQAQLGRLRADSVLSRRDQGPDMGTYLQLLQQLSAQG